MRRHFLLLSLLVILFAISGASAETFVQWTAEQRVYVWLKLNQAEIQRLLPTVWAVTPAASGPTMGANFLVGFLDQTLTLDGQGKPMGTGTGRGVVLGAPAKNKDTGEAGFFVTRIFGSGGAFVAPGSYKNTLPASVRFERSQTGSDGEPPMTMESWVVKPEGGGSLEFRVQYRASSPRRVKAEPKILPAVSYQDSGSVPRHRRRVCYRSTTPVTAGFLRYLNYVLTYPHAARRLAIQPIR